MGIVSSIPRRPLNRAEVESLEAADGVRGVYPVFDDRPGPDEAWGFVVAKGEKMTALALTVDGWTTVGDRKLSEQSEHAPEDGIPYADAGALEELQQKIAATIGE